MPISTPRNPRYAIVVTQKTPKAAAASIPALQGKFRAGQTITDNPDFDEHVRVLRNDQIVRDLARLPVAAAAGNAQLLDRTGSIRRRFDADLDGVIPDSFEIAAASGVIANYIGRGIWDLSIDPAFGATTPSTEALFATFQPRARLRLDPTQFLTWPVLTIETRGGATVVIQGPRAIGQPGPRTFVEGAITEFSENIASFFTGGTAPFTWEVLNADGTALTDFVLDEIVELSPTEVIAYITSPACQGDVGVYPLLYRKTDANQLSASVVQINTVIADPLPVVLSNPAPRSVPINQSGTIVFRVSDYFSDNTPLTITVDAGAGVALPAGYSFSVAGDALTLTYPTEGGAVTRNLRIVAMEQSGFARSVSVPFVFSRPASATIIGTAAPVEVPENAVTRFIVNVPAFIASASVYGVRGRGNTALPAPFTVVSNDAGVLTIDADIANNQVEIFEVEYFGDAVVVNSEWISYHNAPVAGVISITQVNVLSVTVDVVAASDDPGVNVIVPGSVSITSGQAEIVGGRILVTPDPNYVGPATLFYTLEAGDETTDAAASFDFTALALGEPGTPLNLTATVGLSFSDVNLLAAFIPGTFPLDATSLQFTDNQGTLLGKSVTIANVGTFTIGATGIMSVSARGDQLGAFQLLVYAADIQGNTMQDNLPLQVVYSQIANPGAPAPGSVEPNLDDGKPILQLGYQIMTDWSGEPIWAGRHQKLLAHISSFEKRDAIIAGDYDPQTGFWTLDPGQIYTFRFIRPDQDNSRPAHPEIDSGTWVIKYTLDPAVSPNTAQVQVSGYTLTESGSAGDQKRFTFTTIDTDQNRNVSIRGLTSGGRLRIDYIGPLSREGLGDGYHPDFIAYAFDYKIGRWMNTVAVINSKITRDSDWMPDDWYDWYMSMAATPLTVPTVNRDKLKFGLKYKTIFDVSYLAQQAAWINLPYSFGASVIEGIMWSIETGQWEQVMVPAVRDNFAAISAAIPTEYFAHGVRIANSMTASQYPLNRVLLVEIGNEHANSAQAGCYRYCRALGWAIQGVDQQARNADHGYGFLNAKALRALFAGIRSVRPQQELAGVMTTLVNQGVSRLQDAWAGFLEEAAKEPGIRPDEVFWSGANYYDGLFKWQNSRSPETGNPFYSEATDLASFRAIWAQRHSESEAALFQSFEDYMLDPATAFNSNGATGNIYGVRETIIAFRNAAIAAGARGFICYEGGSHDNGDANSNGILPTYPPAADAAARWVKSIHAERIAAKHVEILLPIAPTNPAVTTGFRPTNMVVSNFLDLGPDNPSASINSPWIERITGQMRGPYEGLAKGWQVWFRGNGVDPAPVPPPTSGGGGGGGGTSPPAALFDRTILSTDTIAGLQAEGWGPNGISHVVVQGAGGEWALRSPNESAAMFRVFRQVAQANPNLTFRVRWQPDGSVTTDMIRFERGGNIVAIRPVLDPLTGRVPIDPVTSLPIGDLTVSLFGQPDVPVLVTQDADLFAGGFVDMEIDYFIATNGVIRVRIGGVQKGEFTGNTNPLAIQNPYIDRVRIRGKHYFSQFEDMTA